MSIAVRCRLCGRPYNLADRLAGQVVQCKECQAAIEVPAAGKPAGATATPRPGVAPAGSPRKPASPRAATAPTTAAPTTAAPTTVAPIPLAPLPAAPLVTPPLASAPLTPSPLLAPRRKKRTSPLVLVLAAVATGVFGLGALAAIAFVAFTRVVPMMHASSFRASASQTAPATSAGTHPVSAKTSNARQLEELLQKLLAALQGFNGALSQVVDGASARRQADQVLAKYNELMVLRPQVLAFRPHITADEDRRLEAMYAAPLRAAVDQLRAHAMRIRQIQDAQLAFGGRLAFDDLHERMGMVHGLRPGFGAGASFQPTAPPTFTPRPTPNLGARAPINRPPITGPRHPPLNHGPRGPGGMPGRRGR
jgi:hypothetical protein